MRSLIAGLLALVLALVLAALALPVLVLADTAPPPAAATDTNNILLAVVALGALSAIVLFNRPRRRKE